MNAVHYAAFAKAPSWFWVRSAIRVALRVTQGANLENAYPQLMLKRFNTIEVEPKSELSSYSIKP